MSFVEPQSRRFSFDVPLPARVTNAQGAQWASPGKTDVLMAHALPMLAGKARVLAWCGAMAQAVKEGEQARAMKLLEAALSVPTRLRLCPDADSCSSAALLFSENAFASAAAAGADSFWKFAERMAPLSQFQ